MKFLIVDDEALILEETVKLLKELGQTELLVFQDELTVLEQLELLHFDVALLDIELPMVNGLDLAQEILNHHPHSHIIFLTGYQEYAIHAFELNAIDYLLKPLTKARLAKALDRLPKTVSTPQDTKLKLQLFNQFEMVSGNEVVRFKRHKTQELLAYLLLNQQKANRDVLCDALYDTVDGRKAIIQLQTLIYQARKDLEPYQDQLKIGFKNQTYYLEINHLDIDALRFKGLSKTDETQTLIKAVESYDKGLLHAHDWPWLIHEQFNFEAKLFTLLDELTKRAETSNNEQFQAWVDLKLKQYSE